VLNPIKKTLLLTAILFAFNAYAAADIKITDAYMKELPPNSPTAAVYLTIANNGDNSDKLIAANTSISKITEVHEHFYSEGMMKMQKVDEVSIPIGKIQFKPHGYHIMLLDIIEHPKAGDNFDLTLEFAETGAITFPVSVKGL